MELSRDFGLPDLGSIRVDARLLSGQVLNGDNQPTPIWLAQGSGGTATALIDESHDVFTKLGFEYADLLVLEISGLLKVKSETPQSQSQIASRLRAACLPDTVIDASVIRDQATELMSDIRQRMSDMVNDDPQRALGYLDPDEQTQTETAMIADGADSLTATLGGSGQFILHVPPLYLVKLLENWPEAFLDGKVFAGAYVSLISASSKRLSLARVVGYLNDVATLLTFQTPNIIQLRRTRLSITLLAREVAPELT